MSVATLEKTTVEPQLESGMRPSAEYSFRVERTITPSRVVALVI